jgi:hypothetical protein
MPKPSTPFSLQTTITNNSRLTSLIYMILVQLPPPKSEDGVGSKGLCVFENDGRIIAPLSDRRVEILCAKQNT